MIVSLQNIAWRHVRARGTRIRRIIRKKPNPLTIGKFEVWVGWMRMAFRVNHVEIGRQGNRRFWKEGITDCDLECHVSGRFYLLEGSVRRSYLLVVPWNLIWTEVCAGKVQQTTRQSRMRFIALAEVSGLTFFRAKGWFDRCDSVKFIWNR